MLPNKVRVPLETANKLKALSGRTGLTPNILCRFALCSSLEDLLDPPPVETGDDGGEFNRYTLFGEHEELIEAMIIQRTGTVATTTIVNHLARGVAYVSARVKCLSDLLALVPSPSAESDHSCRNNTPAAR